MTIQFPKPPYNEVAERLRDEVRVFLREQLAGRTALQRAESWNGFDRDFSRALGQRGWLGMTWPKQYGGHERSAFERYVVAEECLAAGAPVAAHWIADRQSGPSLLKFGSESQKRSVLPGIAAGEIVFCIGMSEPDAGSDLAAVRTTAVRDHAGWRVNGTKLWTTGAHHADFMILLCRTSPKSEDRHGGLSQFLVDLREADPAISIRPIIDMAAQHHFNEVHFQDAFLPDGALIGVEGQGWDQVMSELAFERSGPERFLSSMQLIIEMIRALQGSPDAAAATTVGRLVAHLVVLRSMSRGVASMLQAGENPSLQAAIVKDLGAVFEQSIPEIALDLLNVEPDISNSDDLSSVLAITALNSPTFSLRGGTREILRGIIAKGLGAR
ncbi:acyl-CoA dehydrogenase family protein [Sphingobium ummariense]